MRHALTSTEVARTHAACAPLWFVFNAGHRHARGLLSDAESSTPSSEEHDIPLTRTDSVFAPVRHLHRAACDRSAALPPDRRDLRLRAIGEPGSVSPASAVPARRTAKKDSMKQRSQEPIHVGVLFSQTGVTSVIERSQ